MRGSVSEPVARGGHRCVVAEQVDAQERGCSKGALDVVDAPRAQHAAAIDDRHAGAHLAELGEDVAADQDRLAHRPQLSQDLAHLDPRARVEPRCGLVEDEQRRIVDERVRKAQPLPHSARQGLDIAVATIGQPHDLEQLADHRRAAVRRHAVAAGEEVEVLPDPEVVVDTVEVGHVADAPTNLDRIGIDRDAGHVRLARRLRQQGGQDLHHRRLPGAVRPDQAEDLTGTDDEVDAGDGKLVAVALDEAAGLDDRCRGHHSLITPAALALTKMLAWPKLGFVSTPVTRTSMRPVPLIAVPGSSMSNELCWLMSPRRFHAPLVGIAHLEREPLGPEPAESALIAEDHRRVGADQDLELRDGHVGRVERERDAVDHRAVAQDHRARPAVRGVALGRQHGNRHLRGIDVHLTGSEASAEH